MNRARVVEDFTYGGIGIFIERGPESAKLIVGRDGATGSVRSFMQGETPPPGGFEPFVKLTDDEARAVLQALTRHYDGAEDTRSLRRDYDAERARVDKLLDKVTSPVIIVDTAGATIDRRP